ncbi:MAG: HAMP domain-containing protein [Saprospiraceae bacterium]|nr:HAMP domain-containing protein [Saprospiraceae bacterium]MCB9320671.1 HAMP domain-containing protein [Lewinellaceae bacterium]
MTLKNRIALNYMVATAFVVALVFAIIYLIVHTTVYYNLDRFLTYEAEKHLGEIVNAHDSILFINKAEWAEREHREVQVQPVFIQLTDPQGHVMDRSPNLKLDTLFLDQTRTNEERFNTQLNHQAIRQIQVPYRPLGTLKGYIVAAASREDALFLLRNLRNILLILFPVVLIGLFIITRIIAGRSIRPIQVITTTADRITRNNLNERITPPKNKDELYTLTASINELLQRMEDALEREKQFTSDASHELRTPLSVLKGTLEVLNRKWRTPEEYREKIQYSIQEIDRMSRIVDQLLMLARFEKEHNTLRLQPLSLPAILDEVISRNAASIEEKKLRVALDHPGDVEIISDPYYMDMIIENLLSNAIKYSPEGAQILIHLEQNAGRVKCVIKDHGIGIKAEDIPLLFNPFYRSEALKHHHISGNGLGLSIVKKACQIANVKIHLNSMANQGTEVELVFNG